MEIIQQLIPKVSEWAAQYGFKMLGAAAILFFGLMAARILTKGVQRAMPRARVEETLAHFLAQIIHVTLAVFVFIAALNSLGFQTASLIAVVGAAGLAIGLALQSHLASLAARVLILFFRPFRKGDFVEAAGISGSVESITMLKTHLKAPDGKDILVPNTAIFSDKIINYSSTPHRRIDLVIGVGAGEELARAKDILKEVMAADPRVLADPPASVEVLEIVGNGFNLAVRPWVKTADYWPVKCELTEKIKFGLDRMKA
ncbi:MAG: mechanosensitive ion channel domain-containing protein [Pseudomonadota bacterium]